MAFRKLPGVSVSATGLRLSQKFAFLLFLSGLVTLSLGALFFLPDSVRLKRLFLLKSDGAITNPNPNPVPFTTTTTTEATVLRGRLPVRQGAELSPKIRVIRKPGALAVAAAAARTARTVEDVGRLEPERRDATVRSAAPKNADFTAFNRCLLKPALGSERGKPSDPQTAQRRDKVREVRAF